MSTAKEPAEHAHQAIDEALIVCELPPIGDGEPVRDALQRLISWHVGVALDPRVSSCAPAGVEEFPLPEPDPGWHSYTPEQVRDILRSYSASLGLQARTEGKS